MKKIYIAGPFFNPEQIAVIEGIEKAIDQFPSLSFYSPRLDGVLMNMTKEERAEKKKEIFQLNCYNISNSDLVLAVIDGRDTGTIWELGYAYGSGTGLDIVTYTNQDFGINVMIQESINGHIKGMDRLRDFLIGYTSNVEVDFFSRFRDFNEGTF